MNNNLEEYFKGFANSVIEEVNEYKVIVIKQLEIVDKKNIFLEGGWRLFKDKIIVLSSSENNQDGDLIVKLNKYLGKKHIKNIYLGKEINDLYIELTNGYIMQLIVESNQYENWVLNEEIICLPGGEVTYFI